MKKLIVLFIEFALIIGLVIGIYLNNLSKKVDYSYHYTKPLLRTRLNLSDTELKKEIIFFLAKDLGLYQGNFEILDVVFLYTGEIAGADYILVTLKAPDGRLCQITVSRISLPFARWELNPKTFSVIEPLKTILESKVEVPRWMQDLGVTDEQLQNYYTKHPELAVKGEYAFFDEETGSYNLPADWYQAVFNLVTGKDKTIRLIPDKGERLQADTVNFYWKADYPSEYLGLGYRGYLYQKIEESKSK